MDPNKEVRQILMNELGLTREFVRSEVEKIVAETVEKHLKSMDVQGHFKRIVDDKFDAMVGKCDTRYNQSAIREIVREAAREKVAQFIMDNIQIGKKDDIPYIV